MTEECYYCGKELPMSQGKLRRELHTDCEREQSKYIDEFKEIIRKSIIDNKLDDETNETLKEIIVKAKLKESQVEEINLDIYNEVIETHNSSVAEKELQIFLGLEKYLEFSPADAAGIDRTSLGQLSSWRSEDRPPEKSTTKDPNDHAV